MKPFPIGGAIPRFQFGESGSRPNRSHVFTNNAGGEFAAFQGHQHSAAREWIDERSRITDGQ